MANLLYANNAVGTLAAPITNTAATLTLNVGQAAAFPNPSAPQVFYATLTDAATQTLIEIVQCTAVSGNIVSIVRAQDGTSALSWNAGDIFSQRTIAQELRGFENAAEGNFAALGVPINPSTSLGITGTTTNDNANTGAFGEYLAVTAVATPMSSAVIGVVAAVALTNGDWDVTGTINYSPAGGTAIQNVFAGVSTSPTAFGGLGTVNVNFYTSGTGAFQIISSPVVRISLPASVTPYSVFLLGDVSFASGSCTAQGFIRARRIR